MAEQIATEIHHENASDYIERTCASLEGASLRECIAEAIETAGEYRRAEYDLRAQQEMAKWAKWLLGVTMITVGVTALGVYFVWRTLGEAQEATAAAFAAVWVTRQVGQRQTRAYVYPSFVGFFDAEEVGVEGLPEDWATVAIHIKNYGQSAAKQARAVMSREVWAFPPPEIDRKPLPLPDFAEDRSDIPPGNESENRLDFTLPEAERAGIEDELTALYVFGRIEYFDTFGDPHFTNFLFYSTGDDFLTGKFRTHSFGNEAD